MKGFCCFVRLEQYSMNQTSADKKAKYIIGIGASAGGLEALKSMLSKAEPNRDMAYVVVQHLSPDYKSMMVELLQRDSKISVKQVKSGDEVHANTVYLIPPRKFLSVYHGKLILEDQPEGTRVLLPINIFFRSLAKDFGSRAIAVILSGTGSDGSLGLKDIKEADGLVIAQSPDSAKFDGMPQSAISTGLVDMVLKAEDIIDYLDGFLKHPFAKTTKALRTELDHSEDSLTRIMLVIRDYCGVDFSFYKENTLIRRLERRLGVNRVTSLSQYIKLLQESDEEKETLFREFLIGVTRFFRDEAAFNALSELVFKKFLKSGKDQIRIWSVGCSTGEEAYSLAITLEEMMAKTNTQREYKIFATDIDRRAVEHASAGYYSDSLLSELDEVRLQRYFVKREGGWQIKKQIRERIIFAPHNVLKDPPFSKLDLIVTRNLFIYFKPESQERTLNKFHSTLKPNGILFMGNSESLGGMEVAFESISSKHKLFKRKATYKPPLITENYRNDKLSISRENKEFKGRSKNEQKKVFLMNAALEAVLPASVVIDDTLTIYQVFNNINPFLEVQSGTFSQNLASVLSRETTMLVNNIVRKLKLGDSKVSYDGASLKINDEKRIIDLSGVALTGKEHIQYFLITFRDSEEGSALSENKTHFDAKEQYVKYTAELEQELQFTKENLQATVEELETSNEELQSSNEELIASNEELQSTNEELQSVNEELYTVNAEYESKIDELTEVNNDVNNLLKNTGIAAVYLDKKLNVRKLTPKFEEMTNIGSSDIGRPIEHFDINRVYEDFTKDVKQVQEDLKIVEKEIEVAGNLYLIRIVPYRTSYNAVDGVLATLVTINAIREERLSKDQALERLQLALEMGEMAWWTWHVPSGKVDFHEKKATMLGYSYKEFPKDVDEVNELIHRDDLDKTKNQMQRHLKGEHPNYEVTYRIKTKDGSYRWYYDKGGIVERDKDGAPLFFIGIVADVTKEKLLQIQLLHEDVSIQHHLNQLQTPALIVNANLKMESFNESFAQWLNKPAEQLENKTFDAIGLHAFHYQHKEPIQKMDASQAITLILDKGSSQMVGTMCAIGSAENLTRYLVVFAHPTPLSNSES